MKAFARHGKINGMLCLPGALMFVTFIMFSLTGCGSSGGGGGETYEKLTRHQIETQSSSIVDVTLTTRNQQDQPVTDLGLGDFILDEDGVPVNPATAELAVYKRDSLPPGATYSLNTVLLIDNSPSQAAYIESVKDAAKALVDFLDDKKQQKIAVVSFRADGSPYVVQGMTNNPSDLKTKISGLSMISTPGTGFDLYGGILLGLDLWDNDTSVTDGVIQQGFLVALTDGHDTAGKYTIADITAKQNAANSDDDQPKQIVTVIVGPDSAPADFKTINNVPACPDNGYFVVADPTTQDKNNITTLISTIASNSKKNDSIQQIMLAYADSFYWLRYKTDKLRGTGAHSLVVSIDNNPNTGIDATVSGNFDTGLFYTGLYANLIPHYAGATYPWYVDATFTAQDINGNSVTDLSPADIIATETVGLVATTIDNTTSELALYTRNTLPEGYTFNINTVLVIDNSPSQEENLDDIKSAAKSFVANMDPDQKIAIIAYNANPSDGITDGRPQLVKGLTDDKNTLNSAIDDIEKTTVATDFYGALLTALDVSADDPEPAADPDDPGKPNFNQTFIIALTDGNETLNANTRASVKNKITEIKTTHSEMQLPQINVLAIGNQAVSYKGIAGDPPDPANPIAHSDLNTAYDVVNENGFYRIDENWKYVHGVYTNQITQLLNTLQAKIKDYANGSYWIRYKTGLTNATLNPELSIRIKDNDNTAFSFDQKAFSTANLYDGNSNIVLTVVGDSYGGIQDIGGSPGITISVDPGNNTYLPFTLSAETNPAAGQTFPYEPVYTWTITPVAPATETAIVAYLDGDGNAVPGKFDVKMLGESTITVTDTANFVSIDSPVHPKTDLLVDVKVNSTPDYKLTAYNTESQYPGFVNAMLNVSYRKASTNLFEFMPDLTRNYFEVYEDIDGNWVYAATPVDNEAQDLQAWKHDTLPDGYTYTFKTVLLIDNSQSQADILAYSKQAAKAMIDKAFANQGADRITGPSPDNAVQQEMAIVSFDQDGYYTLVKPFSNNRTDLKNAVDTISVGIGGTNLYDALVYALNLWNDDYRIADGDKSLTQGVVIAITDGYDSNSASSTLDSVKAARDLGSLSQNIIGVGVINNDFTTAVKADVMNGLDNFGTDGFYNVTDPGNSGDSGLQSTMLSIQAQLADYAGSFYWLRYLTDAKQNANPHAIQIAVRNNYDAGDIIIDATDLINDNHEVFYTSNLLAAGDVYLYKDSPNPTQKLVDDTGVLLHKFVYYVGGAFTESDNYTLHVATYKDPGAHTYTWGTDDSTVVDVQVDLDHPTDSSTAVLVPKTNVDPTTKTASASIWVQNEQNKSISFTATVEELPYPPPLLHYAFDDGTAKDSSGNGYDGEVSGAILTTDRNGEVNKSYLFTDDYISIKNLHYGLDASSFAATINKISVCAWIKTPVNDQKPRCIIGFDASEYWSVVIKNGRIVWRYSTPSSATINDMETPQSYADGQWHFIFATYDFGAKIKNIYVDGELAVSKVVQETEPIGTNATSRYGYIGHESEARNYGDPVKDMDTSSWFEGAIDDVIIFDEVLSASDIRALALAGGSTH